MFKYEFAFKDFDLNPAHFLHESATELSVKECEALAEKWSKGKGIQSCAFVGIKE